MKRTIDLALISKIVLTLLIGSMFFYIMFSMIRFGEGQSDRETDSIQAILDKALVQCYALEGRYPTNIEYVEKYGVIFDNEKYLYHYEWYGGNLKPSITVIKQ